MVTLFYGPGSGFDHRRLISTILGDCMKACTTINVETLDSVAVFTKGEDATGELITMFLDNQVLDSTMVIGEGDLLLTPEKESVYCLV